MHISWTVSLVVIGCVIVGGCGGGAAVAPTSSTSGNSGAGAAVSASPPGRAGTVDSKGNIGPHKFQVDCTGAAGATLTQTLDATTLACHDATAGVEITIKIVNPKVGTMDASPNKGASLITFNAGDLGHCENPDGRCNTLLVITQWDAAGGHGAGTFGMNWHDSDAPPRKEGQLEGSFSF